MKPYEVGLTNEKDLMKIIKRYEMIFDKSIIA
jgi:hypothetical protein